MSFKLKEMDGKLGKMIDETTIQKEMVLLDYKDTYQVWAEPDYLKIKGLGVNVFYGVCYEYQKDEACYALDHHLYLFFDEDGVMLFYETGEDLRTAVQGYCFTYDVPIIDGSNLNCIWIYDNGYFLETKVVNIESPLDSESWDDIG